MNNPTLIFYAKEPRYANTTINTHSHQCYELVYFIKANGKLSINEQEYTLNSGNIYFAYPNTPHSEVHFSDGMVIFLGFKCDNFPQHLLKETVYDIPEHLNIYNIIEFIFKEAINQEEYFSELISNMLSNIIVLMQRYSSNIEQSTKTFHYITNYINEYYNQTIDFKQLAKLSGYSYDHFRKIFLKNTGLSPKQYQINIRLEKAAKLLKDNYLNCTEIASLCGFSNSAQFSKMFRDKFGATPKQFKKQYN